jgi:hypothetical protein
LAGLRFVVYVTAALSCGLAGDLRAQQAHASPFIGPRAAIDFNIAGQPLVSALEAFSSKSGIQILYESSLALKVNSRGLVGSVTPDEALEILLEDTGLIVRYTGPNAVTIGRPSPLPGHLPPANVLSAGSVRLPTLAVIPPTLDRAALRSYSDAVRGDVESALQRDPSTRGGNYRVGVRLWISEDRKVTRAQVSQSTGSARRDQAVVEALEKLTISRDAPANTPRPIRLVIAVRSH